MSVTVVAGLRARGSRPRRPSRPTSAKPFAGISPAPVPVALTDDDLASVTRTSATLVDARDAAAARVRAPRAACTRAMLPAGTPLVGGVERERPAARCRSSVARGLERQVDEPADAVLADAGVRSSRCRVGDLSSVAAEDLPAERGGRVVDVEEVAVDAGDGARLVRGLGQRAAGGDRALPQRVRLDRRVGEVHRQDLMVVPAGRVDRLQVAQRDSGPDGLGLVDQRELVRSARRRRREQRERCRECESPFQHAGDPNGPPAPSCDRQVTAA